MESSTGKMGDFRANWKAKRAELLLRNRNKQTLLQLSLILWYLKRLGIFWSKMTVIVLIIMNAWYFILLWSLTWKKSEMNRNTGVLGNIFALVRLNWARESLGKWDAIFYKTWPRAVSIARLSTLSQMTSLSHTIVLLADVHVIQMRSLALTV